MSDYRQTMVEKTTNMIHKRKNIYDFDMNKQDLLESIAMSLAVIADKLDVEVQVQPLVIDE